MPQTPQKAQEGKDKNEKQLETPQSQIQSSARKRTRQQTTASDKIRSASDSKKATT